MQCDSSSILQVNMLGGLSLSLENRSISDSENRSHKVWLLLAYMIYNRNRNVTQEELCDLLWGSTCESANPVNALKTLFHRVRSTLEGLGPNMGHTLICRRDSSYVWNPDFPLVLDADVFESICQKAANETDPERQLDTSLKALALYQGDFLEKLSAKAWVAPLNAHFHSLFLDTVKSALPAVLEAGRYEQAKALSRQAIRVEPYHEELYVFLMQAQLALGDQKGVIATYDAMSELLSSHFGVMPSEESTRLYREATRTTNSCALDLSTLREQLCRTGNTYGALLCDYDFFQAIYCAVSRSLARSGDSAHIALISVCAKNKELTKRSLDCCMDNLQSLLRTNLRKGDIFARCSVSQYVLLLPKASYENTLMICDRIKRIFSRQYPHSPARLHTGVQPLDPLL